MSQVIIPNGHTFQITPWNGQFGEKKGLVFKGLVKCTSADTENMARELKKGPGARLYSLTDAGKKLADYLHLCAKQQHLPLEAEGQQGSGDSCKACGKVPPPHDNACVHLVTVVAVPRTGCTTVHCGRFQICDDKAQKRRLTPHTRAHHAHTASANGDRDDARHASACMGSRYRPAWIAARPYVAMGVTRRLAKSARHASAAEVKLEPFA